jgi:GR25 family glycosyltransferase involved in LPS biosynthesis
MIDKFFDKIYILNLTRRTDRKEKTIQRFQKIGLENYEFFKAIDGRLLKPIWNQMSGHFFQNPNYLGSTLSHLSIYQDAIDRGFEKILIIEDDCYINKNLNSIWESNQSDLIDADLWYFGYIPVRDDGEVWDYNIIETWYTNNVFKPKNLWGLFSYGLRKNLMEEIIQYYQNSMTLELDRFLIQNIQPTDRSRALAPQLWACEVDYSDNTSGVDYSMFMRSTGFSNRGDFI